MVENEASIDIELLISLVEQRPVLWDKTTELYKNRVATQAAWREIMIVFDSNFETKEEKKRQSFVKLIIQRWTHVRDTYNRSCKKIRDQKRSGSAAKTAKPYVYSKRLIFLQKVLQPKETITNVTTANNSEVSEDQENNSEERETNSIQTQDNISTMSPIPNRIPKKHAKNDVSHLNAKMMKFMDSCSNNDPTKMNRHMSFFNGIIPSLDKFDEDEVLEFQMGVLQLLKKIKDCRRNRESSVSLPGICQDILPKNI